MQFEEPSAFPYIRHVAFPYLAVTASGDIIRVSAVQSPNRSPVAIESPLNELHTPYARSVKLKPRINENVESSFVHRTLLKPLKEASKTHDEKLKYEENFIKTNPPPLTARKPGLCADILTFLKQHGARGACRKEIYADLKANYKPYTGLRMVVLVRKASSEITRLKRTRQEKSTDESLIAGAAGPISVMKRKGLIAEDGEKVLRTAEKLNGEPCIHVERPNRKIK